MNHIKRNYRESYLVLITVMWKAEGIHQDAGFGVIAAKNKIPPLHNKKMGKNQHKREIGLGNC